MNNKYLVLVGCIERNAHIILESYLPTTHASQVSNLRQFFTDIKVMIGEYGMPWTIARVKSSRVAILRTLTGSPLTTSSEGGVKLTDGWPDWLSYWRLEIPKDRIMKAQDIDKVRYLLTVLSSLRSIMVDPVVDTSTITDEYKGIWDHINPVLLHTLLKSMGYTIREGAEVCWRGFHFTTKSGPNGPALISSSREFGKAFSTYRFELETLGGDTFTQVCQELGKLAQTDDSVILGKLSYFADKEGKTRLIAMCDYWTQSVLRPIHLFLMELLSRLPTDCTKDHGKALRYLSNFPGPFYSLDLSNATDRMPFWLQESVMSYFLGKVKARAWARLLVERDYVLKVAPKGKSETVRNLRYSTGQPMGAYSSWASMAFTHHIIIQWAAYNCASPSVRKDWKMFKKYVVLGDDVVIADSAVAESYKKLLLQLDMPVSMAKTHVSQDSYEFAKRWIMFNREVTPFSIGGLGITMRRYSLLFSFLGNQATHGWVLRDKDREFDMVHKLIRQDENTRPGRAHSRLFLYKLFYHLQHIRELTKTQENLWPKSMRIPYHEVASTKFHQDFVRVMMSLDASQPKFSDTSITSLVAKAIRVALDEMVKQDLSNFQGNVKGAIARSLSIPKVVATGVKAGVISYWLPPLNCLAHLFKDSLEALNEPEKVFEYGIAKFFIGKGVLSMDRSNQVILAESAVTKKVLNIFLELGKLQEGDREKYFHTRHSMEVRLKKSLLLPIQNPRGLIVKFGPSQNIELNRRAVTHIDYCNINMISEKPIMWNRLCLNPTYQLHLLRGDAHTLLGSEHGSAPEKADPRVRVFREENISRQMSR